MKKITTVEKITTLVFFIDCDGRIFLSKKLKGHGAGKLNGYGGKVFPVDESIKDAALREIREECGVIALSADLQEVAVIDFYKGEREVKLSECHIFLCHSWQGNFRDSDEMSSPIAYSIKNLPYEEMWEGDRIWLPIVLYGKKSEQRCTTTKI